MGFADFSSSRSTPPPALPPRRHPARPPCFLYSCSNPPSPSTPLCFVDRAMKSILECSGESRLTSSPPRVTHNSRPRFKIPPACTRIIAIILSPVRSAHVRSLGPKRSLVSSLFDQHPFRPPTLRPRCSPLTLDCPHTPCDQH